MSDERIAVTIQVLYVGQQQGAIDGDPILRWISWVVERGNPPRPLATSLRVPMAKLALLRAGTEFLGRHQRRAAVGARHRLVGPHLIPTYRRAVGER